MKEEDWLAANDPVTLLNFLGLRASPRKRRLFACACAWRVSDLMTSIVSRRAIHSAEQYADGTINSIALAFAEHHARTVSAEAVRNAHAIWSECPTALEARAAWVAVWAACAAENTCDPGNKLTEPGSLEASFQGCLALRTAQVASWSRSVANELKAGTDEKTGTESGLFFSFLRGLKHTVQRIEKDMHEGAESCETVAQVRLVRELFGNPFQPINFNRSWLQSQDYLVERIAETIYDECLWDDLHILVDALIDAGCDEPAILEHFRQPGLHARGCWALDLILGVQ